MEMMCILLWQRQPVPLFQSPFQAKHWSQTEVLFIDIDHTGCHHFPYLQNVVCLNRITSKYIACGRGLINHQDAGSIGTVLSKLADNVKICHNEYNIKTAYKEILVDFDDAESNAFIVCFGQELSNVLRGSAVHFKRSAMRVSKLVNPSTTSTGYHIFMTIAKRIPDEPCKQSVDEAFDVLYGLRSVEHIAGELLPDLRANYTQVDTSRWTETETWVNWWKRPHVLKKLSKAYSSLSVEDWEHLPGSTNLMELINHQSIPENQKLVSLKPLVEHIYLEDRRQAVLEVATTVNITITYQVKPRQRTRLPLKPPERWSALSSKSKDIPIGKGTIGTHISVEFYNDSDCVSTTWHKGTIIGATNKAI